jgi:hypothetical protein
MDELHDIGICDIDETTWARLFQLHNKLSNVQPALK